MKINVIIGSEGTLGKHIVEAKLLDSENLVIGYDRATTSSSNHFRFKYVSGDVANRSDLLRLKNEILAIQSDNRLGNSLSSIINSFAAKDYKYNSDSLPQDRNGLNWMLWGWQHYPDQDFLDQYDTNVVGVHRILTSLYECYKDSTSCSIVNFSSQYAKRNLNQEVFKDLDHYVFKPPAYSASKAALENYTEYLSQVFQGTGIRINSIAPGVVDSGQSKEFKEAYSKQTLKSRLMHPSEIIGAIEFLTSESSVYMTGSCLTIDGGWSVK